MKYILSPISLGVCLLLSSAGTVFAANPHTINPTGQPGQTCLTTQTGFIEPGNAASARGSAFNENGGIAGGVYAGNGISATTANSGNAVSQYDVACFQNSQMP